ncbi:MAG: isopentenyl-diphosphate delta-isomerase, partial [Bdellovibrio sp. CG_4_9_14_3_um_filter_39_7]
MTENQVLGQRKAGHIELSTQAQVDASARDQRFYYEPMLNP